MSSPADSIAVLLHDGKDTHAELLAVLKSIWRDAFEGEGQAYQAWCRGEVRYEAFVAALDREHAAANALADCARARR